MTRHAASTARALAGWREEVAHGLAWGMVLSALTGFGLLVTGHRAVGSVFWFAALIWAATAVVVSPYSTGRSTGAQAAPVASAAPDEQPVDEATEVEVPQRQAS